MNCHWQLCGLGCTCNCCGIAATSVAPVKRYNDLVPDVFPKSPPSLDAPVDAATARKLKKLVEYVDKNPQRGPKVSRRLARRLGKELSRQHHAYALLAVEAYSVLLGGLKPSDTRLLARELIVQRVTRGGKMDASSAINARSSVVGLLSRHSRPDMRAAAAKLFRQFVELQDSGDYMPQLAALAPAICAAAVGSVPGAATSATGSPEAAGSDEDSCAAEALGALDAYDSLVTRLSLPDELFPSVAGVLVEAYSHRRIDTVGDQAAGSVPQQRLQSAAAAARLAAGIGSRTQAADGTPQRLAVLLDKASQEGLWRDARGPALFADLCSGIGQPHQAWPVYEAMLKHSASVSAAERKVVLDLAVDLAAAHLREAFATASLALLLQSAVRNNPTSETDEAVPQAVRRLAQRCGPVKAVSALTALLLGRWDATPSAPAVAAIAAAAQANGEVSREAAAPLLGEARAVLAAETPTLEQQQQQQQGGGETQAQRRHRQDVARVVMRHLKLDFEMSESWNLDTEPAQRGSDGAVAAAAPGATPNGPAGGAHAPTGTALPALHASPGGSGNGGSGDSSSVNASASPAPVGPAPDAAAASLAAASPPPVELSNGTLRERRQAPEDGANPEREGTAPEQAPVEAVGPPQKIPKPAGESATTAAGDAMAVLDRLLAAHGVPAMRPQPPPGLISTAA